MKFVRFCRLFSFILMFLSYCVLYCQHFIMKTDGSEVRLILQFRDGLKAGETYSENFSPGGSYAFDSLSIFLVQFDKSIEAAMTELKNLFELKILNDNTIYELVKAQKKRADEIEKIKSKKKEKLSHEQEVLLSLYAQEEVEAVNTINRSFEIIMGQVKEFPVMDQLNNGLGQSIAKTVYEADEELIASVIKDYVRHTAALLILEKFGFRGGLYAWCHGCCEAPLAKRIAIVIYLMHQIQMQFPDKTVPVVITSLGSGRLLQEFLLLRHLKNIGYSNITVNLIDFAYGDKETWLIEKPGVFNSIENLKDVLELGLGGNFMDSEFATPAQRQVNIFQDIQSYMDACIKTPSLKSHVFMAIDIGYFPYFSVWPDYTMVDTNGAIFYINNQPKCIVFLPKYTKSHLYLHKGISSEVRKQMKRIIDLDPFKDDRLELEKGTSLNRAKLPEYVSHVLTEIGTVLKDHFGFVETMYFIDTTLILHELVLKTFQPSSIGVLINCDFFEQLTTQNFESYDYQSLYELDCKAHQWVPRKYNVIPVKKNDDHWMFFHGNFDEVK